MINYATVQEIYNSHYGSEQVYKRNYFDLLIYTEGVKDFQEKLDAYWFVDNIISCMALIIKEYKEYDQDFFVVEISVNKNSSGYMEIHTEGYVDGKYNEHISIIKQDIPFIDLPTNPDKQITVYKFFLELSCVDPLVFCLLLPREH